MKIAKAQEGEHTTIKKIECRLRVEKIFDIKGIDHDHDSEEKTFLDNWHRASRLLFSDESISLRNVDPLLEIKLGNDGLKEEGLAELLQSKMPTLGEFTCLQFAMAILNGATVGSAKLSMASPMQILVTTALYDKESTLCSYGEFVRRMKNSHRVHPIIRMAAWVTMITRETQQKDPDPSCLDILKQLKLVDQVGFPLLTGTTSAPISLLSCQTFTRQGDYTDIAWMADSMQHGHVLFSCLLSFYNLWCFILTASNPK